MYQYYCCQCYGGVCRHKIDSINIDTHIGTRYIILAKHWMWLPDDDFMWTETFWSRFYNVSYFNNLRILQIVFISWKIKCWILLMHGATVKFRLIYVFTYLLSKNLIDSIIAVLVWAKRPMEGTHHHLNFFRNHIKFFTPCTKRFDSDTYGSPYSRYLLDISGFSASPSGRIFSWTPPTVPLGRKMCGPRAVLDTLCLKPNTCLRTNILHSIQYSALYSGP